MFHLRILKIVISPSIFILMLCVSSYSAESYTFADIAWGSSEYIVKDVLSKRYNYVKQDDEGDLLFRGTIKDVHSTIIAVMVDKKLVRVVVLIEPDTNLYRHTYRNFKETLNDKYGPPEKDEEFYSSPYERGDGYEEQAISNNKGFLITKWPKASDGSTIEMQSRKSLTIALFYDTIAGKEEEARRTAKSTSDL